MIYSIGYTTVVQYSLLNHLYLFSSFLFLWINSRLLTATANLNHCSYSFVILYCEWWWFIQVVNKTFISTVFINYINFLSVFFRPHIVLLPVYLFSKSQGLSIYMLSNIVLLHCLNLLILLFWTIPMSLVIYLSYKYIHLSIYILSTIFLNMPSIIVVLMVLLFFISSANSLHEP